MFKFLNRHTIPLALSCFLFAFSQFAFSSTMPKTDQAIIDENFTLLSKIVAIESWRQPDRSNEKEVLVNLQKIKDIIWQDLKIFNQTQKNVFFQQHEWKKTIAGKDYWVYAFRLGSGEKLTSLIMHLDTVAPGSTDWQAFSLEKQQRAYPKEKKQEFWTARGAIDDKGPAVFAISAVKAIAKKYDAMPQALAGQTIELLFDTSEETGMSMPYYFKDQVKNEPDFGIVFDSKWCVRAEKGIERSTFFVDANSNLKLSDDIVAVSNINTFNNPVNQIPDKVLTTFTSTNPKLLKKLASGIKKQYRKAKFDDPKYRKAKLELLNQTAAKFQILLSVSGAQHGSVPDKNREFGSNPLVSTLNLIAELKKQNLITANAYTDMALFNQWMWGTKVLGEHHSELLAGDDGIFKPGTTYAVTQLKRVERDNKHALALGVDIRYSMAHHDTKWTGADGVVSGSSLFPDIFKSLIQQFNQELDKKISFTTRHAYSPDIRNPENAYFKTVDSAFKKVTGKHCPMQAIGGGTDAKGYPQLLAVGALFKSTMGYPVNYHGINEAAPLQDLINSRLILIEILDSQIRQP